MSKELPENTGEGLSGTPSLPIINVSGTNGVMSNSQKHVAQTLDLPPTNKVSISNLSYNSVAVSQDKYLYVEFPEGQPHTSIILNSKLGDKSEIYSVRFGIEDIGEHQPPYSGISVLRRDSLGNITFINPVVNSNDNVNVPSSGDSQKKNLFRGQLDKIVEKIGINNTNTDFKTGSKDIQVLEKNQGVMFDISDPTKKERSDFLVDIEDGNNRVSIQVSVYKINGRNTIEVHSLVREGIHPEGSIGKKIGLGYYMVWLFDNCLPKIKEISMEKGMPLEDNGTDIFFTRNSNYQKDGMGYANVVSISKWRKIIEALRPRTLNELQKILGSQEQ